MATKTLRSRLPVDDPIDALFSPSARSAVRAIARQEARAARDPEFRATLERLRREATERAALPCLCREDETTRYEHAECPRHVLYFRDRTARRQAK